MKQPKIDKLTPEQEALVKLRQQKWQHLVLSTARINGDIAIEAMQFAYRLIGEEKPEFLVCDSPYMALENVDTNQLHLGRRIEKKLIKPLQEELENQLNWELIQDLYSQSRPPRIELEGQLKVHIDKQLKFRKFIPATHWLDIAILLDIGGSVLKCSYAQDKASVVQAILENCGWILPYSKTCIICDRPTRIRSDLFNDGEYLHAEGEPAIQFADGFSVYVHHKEAMG
jgi:hypothetical protein